jgi:YVTN family beta-propeller protein
MNCMVPRFFRGLFFLGTLAAPSVTPAVFAGSIPPLTASSMPSSGQITLPSGQIITPTAAPGSVVTPLNPGLSQFPNYVASGAISSVLSPDKKTLLVITSGYNRLTDASGQNIPAASEQYVFVYDLSSGKAVQTQVINVPNIYAGVTFDPSGKTFYLSGGVDDEVYVFTVNSGNTWMEQGTPISLGHQYGVGPDPAVPYPPYRPTPEQKQTAGIAVTTDGKTLVVANTYNDSVTVVDTATRSVSREIDLRPGKQNPAQQGIPGGEYPYWVVLKDTHTAYVSSLRDREVDVIDLTATPAVQMRIKVSGNPNKMMLSPDGRYLYVAEDNSDLIDQIDMSTNQIARSVQTTTPSGSEFANVNRYFGAAPNSLDISSDGQTLYVTNGGSNDVAVITGFPSSPAVVGLIPTTFCPTSVTISGDGQTLYVVNAKSTIGPDLLSKSTDVGQNAYDLQLLKSSLLSIPTPNQSELAALTERTIMNDGFRPTHNSADATIMAEVRQRIKHVIYVLKENRTYDQILGDLGKGNGDPNLTEFGWSITPNFHHLAQRYVDLDNFYSPGEVAANGMPWNYFARETNFGVTASLLFYAGRGTDYEYEGTNRNIPIAYTLPERQMYDPNYPNDPDLLPGPANLVSPDGPKGTPQERGYIWDALVRVGLSVRNYGFMAGYSPVTPPYTFTPAANQVQIAWEGNPTLIPATDIYYYPFDDNYPDFYRELEWEREFTQYEQNGQLPALETIYLPHDDMGNFGTALAGVNTPELQQADNDYAAGKLVEAVAQSPYKYDTLICIIEDEAQGGADHVDAHRMTAYMVGPYVKQGVVVSDHYSTVDLLRTIEDIFGTDHINLNTLTARPITKVFDLSRREWSFTAVPSKYLANTQLPIPKSLFAKGKTPRPTHSSSYWAKVTEGTDMSLAGGVKNSDKMNRIIWHGLKGNVPYPAKAKGAAEVQEGGKNNALTAKVGE